jgi:spermidine synthase
MTATTRLDEWLNDATGYFFTSSKLLHKCKSPYQEMEVYDTPFLGRLLRIDECFMVSEKDEFFYHEALVHVAAMSHPAPKRALVIGGGDGGSSEEALKHPTLQRLTLVELDQVVIDVSKQFLQEVHRGVFDDPRLELRVADGLKYIAETTEKFDLIVLDLTDPFGPSQLLYSQTFYNQCRLALAPGGALTLHVESPITRPQLYARVVKTLESVFKVVRPYSLHIPIYGTYWGMASASDTLDPLTLSAAEIDARIAARKIAHLQFYNGEMHRAMFAMPNYQKNLLAQAGPPIQQGETLIQR